MNSLIGACIAEILEGTLLAIDPGSNSLGYAIYRASELDISGEIKGVGQNYERLHQIADQLVELETPDVLAIELINTNKVLIWSVGTTIASIQAPHLIEVPIPLWHTLREDDYVKTDALDAELIGQVVINRARGLRNLKGIT